MHEPGLARVLEMPVEAAGAERRRERAGRRDQQGVRAGPVAVGHDHHGHLVAGAAREQVLDCRRVEQRRVPRNEQYAVVPVLLRVLDRDLGRLRLPGAAVVVQHDHPIAAGERLGRDVVGHDCDPVDAGRLAQASEHIREHRLNEGAA